MFVYLFYKLLRKVLKFETIIIYFSLLLVVSVLFNVFWNSVTIYIYTPLGVDIFFIRWTLCHYVMSCFFLENVSCYESISSNINIANLKFWLVFIWHFIYFILMNLCPHFKVVSYRQYRIEPCYFIWYWYSLPLSWNVLIIYL